MPWQHACRFGTDCNNSKQGEEEHHLLGVDLQLPKLDPSIPECLFAGDFGHIELIALRKSGRTSRWVKLGRLGATPAAAGRMEARERELQDGCGE